MDDQDVQHDPGHEAIVVINEVKEDIDQLEQEEPPPSSDAENTSGNDQAIADAVAAGTVELEAELEVFRMWTEECVICTEKKPLCTIEQLPCRQHWACRQDCLPDYFEQAIKSQSSYPPRCCGRIIWIEYYEHILSDDLLNRYAEKIVEWHTDPRLRRYCTNDKKFLPPDSYEDIGDNKEVTIAQCTQCSKYTCIMCTKLVRKSKPKHECKPKVPTERNLEYSQDTRFKGCPFCGRLGILENACNHVTCEHGCGQDFCFICLEPWNRGDGHEECGQYNDPEYDEDGYDVSGFHRDSGFDREGYTRAGYNIRGLNRSLERMTGFAIREMDPEDMQPTQLQAALENLDEDELEQARILELIAAVERGQAQGNDPVEQIFAGLLGEDQGRDEEEHPNPEDWETNSEWMENNEEWIPPTDSADPTGQSHGVEHGLPENTEDTDNNSIRSQPGSSVDQDLENEVLAPTAEQFACQHHFDFHYGPVRCSVCQIDSPEFHYTCSDCQVHVCGECTIDFVESVRLNWPGVEGLDIGTPSENDLFEDV